MSTSIEIFSKVNDYIERRMTLRELESWLVFMLPIYLSNPGSATAELVGTIELGLAEIQAGIRSERSLRRLLASYVAYNPIRYQLYPHQTSINVTTSSASQTEPTIPDWVDQSLPWSNVPQAVNV